MAGLFYLPCFVVVSTNKKMKRMHGMHNMFLHNTERVRDGGWRMRPRGRGNWGGPGGKLH